MIKLFNSKDSWSPFVLRILLGVVIFPHGAQKLFGWFGGYGFDGTMDFMTNTVGLPWIAGLFVIIMESVGAVLLVAGVATRFLAFGFTALGLGIMLSSHQMHGFFMNWYGNQAGEGIEFFLLWIAISVSLVIAGGGKFSIDKELIMKKITA